MLRIVNSQARAEIPKVPKLTMMRPSNNSDAFMLTEYWLEKCQGRVKPPFLMLVLEFYLPTRLVPNNITRSGIPNSLQKVR